MLNRLVPESIPFKHSCEGPDDMPAHAKACLLGSNLTLPICDGRVTLGTWQGVWLCEHRDRAGPRKVLVTVNGVIRDPIRTPQSPASPMTAGSVNDFYPSLRIMNRLWADINNNNRRLLWATTGADMGDQYYYSYYFLDISKRGRSTNQPFCISRSSSSSFWVYLGVNLDGLSVTLLGVSTAILAPKGWKIVHFVSINAKKKGGGGSQFQELRECLVGLPFSFHLHHQTF